MKELFAPLMEVFRLPAFDHPDIERAYWAEEDRSKLAHRKFFMIVAIAVFALIGMLDTLTAGESTAMLIVIRISSLALLAAIFVKFNGKCTPDQRDQSIFMFGMTAALSIVLMTVIAPPPAADFYPFLLSATMVFGGSLVVPRFSTMARMCLIANIVYWPTVPFSQSSMPAIYANLFVLSVTTFSVVVGAFAREKLEREQMIYQEQLAEARENAIMSRDTAIQASQAKSHLLANVSHELRTPMNAILGFSEVMKSEIFGRIEQEQYREYVSDIHFAGTLLQANINDLLDVSRLEVNKMSWTDAWTDLNEIIERTITTSQGDARNARVNLSQDIDDENIVILCDLERTAQILINLVTNAVKFSEPGSKIVVSARSGTGSTILQVTDQGCGIATEDIDQIFEPFRQVDSDSMTTKKGGMGLGLSIVQALVKKLDARLSIESEIGVGTAVTVEIPAHRVARKDQKKLAQHPDGAHLTRAAG